MDAGKCDQHDGLSGDQLSIAFDDAQANMMDRLEARFPLANGWPSHEVVTRALLRFLDGSTPESLFDLGATAKERTAAADAG